MILQIQIRKAAPGDAETIVEFNAQLAQETEGRALDRATLRQGVDQLLVDPARGFYWLAEVKGQIVGQLLITYEWSDWRNGWFWWIQSVYVRREWRGRGVFAELYQFIEQQASDRPDVCGLRLYVEGDNARARRTYERLGMKPTSYQIYETDFSEAPAGPAAAPPLQSGLPPSRRR
jgi:GNAT superfamily N-acetyltransferase